jgi:Ca2+-transporting ATPase
LPLQILYLNLVTDVFPALALGLCEGGDKVMRRPPRHPETLLLGRRQWFAVFGYGCLITVTTLSAFWIALKHLELPYRDALTVSFMTLALAQVWHVFNLREI